MKKIAASLLVSIIIMTTINPYVYAAEFTTDFSDSIDLELNETEENDSLDEQSTSDGENLDKLFTENEDISNLEQNDETTEKIDEEDLILNEGKLDKENNTEEEPEENHPIEQSKTIKLQLNREVTTNVNKLQTYNVNSQTIETKKTSKLGKIKSIDVKIYDNPAGSKYIKAGTEYTDRVFYIKLETTLNKTKYYLLSTEPSSERGVVGWVRASDLTTYDHKHVDTEAKTFYFKGTGVAYNRAWGGPKNLVLNTKDLQLLQYKEFNVNMTEMVGNNIWYRGTFEGSEGNIWIHSNHLTTKEEKNISKVGQIRKTGIDIYQKIDDITSIIQSNSDHLNRVYYIKKQVKFGSKLFYLISEEPSSQRGVVGWVSENDIITHDHKHVDTKEKTFYFKGTGVAYSKIWGGSKNLVLNENDMRLLQYKEFKVNMTEQIGTNIWYCGTYEGAQGYIWIHSSHVTIKEENNTSKVGQIRQAGVDIYRQIDDITSKIKASSDHLNRVYYIKKQVKIDNKTFYLISNEPSSTNGVVGWVNSEDILTYSHVSVDKQEKMLYLKGTGAAYSKIWGGSKLIVFNSSDLSSRKGYAIQVDLTEKVGNNIWYRGIVDGKRVWIHSSHVQAETGKATSRLGKINSSDAFIYTRLGDQSSIVRAGDTHTGIVYYIKRETTLHGKKYYLISNQPSSTSGLVGWVEEKDITTHEHVGIDAKPKVFYLKGTGVAYNRPWGGPKNTIYSANEMKNLKGSIFQVELTQRVGSNIWYRGTLKGKTVWIHSSHLDRIKYTTYNLTLQEALNIQMRANPQTDKRPKYAWVSKDYIKNNTVTASALNVRTGPGTGYKSLGQLKNGSTVKILAEYNGWYAIEYDHKEQWVHAHPNDVLYYLNPENFLNDDVLIFQFLDLSAPSGASVDVLNKFLAGKGSLAGQAQAFIDAGKIYGVNDVYLISHAILETGHGTSDLARGVEVGKNKEGKLVLVTDKNRNSLTDIKKVYNMFGIGAYDGCAVSCGAIRAYQEGWTSPYKAIIGGASFIGNKYIRGDNSYNTIQNTLYKMRWNPIYMEQNKKAGHQYATDIGWAAKQVYNMYNLYQQIGIKTLSLEIPVYK